MKSTIQKPKIRHYSVKQLAYFYLISKPTFHRWIEPHQQHIGERNGHYYTSAQVEKIFHVLGIPPLLNN